MIDIEDHIEKLENNSVREFYLDHSSILDIIDTVTNFSSVENMNVLYDGVSNKIKVYNNGAWESSLLDNGIKTLIEKVQSCYLDYYEMYLMRKACTGSSYDKQIIRERLVDYYKLLVCFDLTPGVHGRSDGDILQDEEVSEESMTLEETYYPLFKQIEEDIKHSEVNRIKRHVCDVVRSNSKASVVELNNKMMDLLKVDEGFKQLVLDKIRMTLEEL